MAERIDDAGIYTVPIYILPRDCDRLPSLPESYDLAAEVLASGCSYRRSIEAKAVNRMAQEQRRHALAGGAQGLPRH